LVGYDLSWKFNNQEISKLDSIKVTSPGNYFVSAQKAGSNCKAETDSVSIGYSLIDPLPLPNPNYFACQGESVKLQTIDKSSYTYRWTKNDSLINFTTNIIDISQSGKYVVTVVDDKSCTAKSLPYDVEFINPNTLKFDSLNSICASEHNKINLFARPGGGQFSGAGVFDKSFDPSKAGVGIHKIVYSISFSPTCKSEVSRNIEVVKAFELEFSPNNVVLTNKDDSVSVNAITLEPNLAAHWHPDDFLQDHNLLNQKILPTKDITYNVVVINSMGCKLVKEVKFIMQGAFKELVYFPTAFSPNGDGLNDTFEIISKVDGVFEFKVFDRWGAEIYRETSTKPSWDGNLNNLSKPSFPIGIYNAQLKLVDSSDVIQFVLHVFY
jgi:gliding motility-associated-like protein